MRPFSTVEIPSKKVTRLRFVLVFGACAFLKYKHEAQASEFRKCVINGREEYITVMTILAIATRLSIE